MPATGNHCNIGGGYKHDGLGDLYLDAATQYLQKSGLKIADVDPIRRYDQKAPLVVYDESGTKPDAAKNPLTQAHQQHGQWDAYGSFTHGAESQPARLLDQVANPAQSQELADSADKEFGSLSREYAIEIKEVNKEKAKVYLEKTPEEALKQHPDLLEALSFKAGLLNDIADRPIVSQQKIISQFDKIAVAYIEQGNLAILPEMNYKTNVTASNNVGAEA